MGVCVCVCVCLCVCVRECTQPCTLVLLMYTQAQPYSQCYVTVLLLEGRSRRLSPLRLTDGPLSSAYVAELEEEFVNLTALCGGTVIV